MFMRIDGGMSIWGDVDGDKIDKVMEGIRSDVDDGVDLCGNLLNGAIIEVCVMKIRNAVGVGGDSLQLRW